VLRTFTQPQTPQRHLRLLAKQIETTAIFSATPETNSTNQSCDYIQTMAAALRNGALRCVKAIYYISFTIAGPQQVSNFPVYGKATGKRV